MVDFYIAQMQKSTIFADFNLSVGCFGADIIQKCTKWIQIGVHGLKIVQIFAKIECVCWSIRQMWKIYNVVENTQIYFVVITSL